MLRKQSDEKNPSDWFYLAQHYPGGDWTDIGEGYAEMRLHVGRMVELIRSRLPELFSPSDP